MNNLRETTRGDCLLIELTGKLDASTTPEIQARLLEKLRGGEKYLALDFSAVSYLASSGLRMLLVMANTTHELEGRLVLCGLDQALSEMLRVVGFLPNFQVAPDQETALNWLQA